MIPKIIHQTAPTDLNKWNPIWRDCQKSWLDNFLNFKYVCWNDEDLRYLVATFYNEYLSFYDSLPVEILRVDFARFCILHQFGGIYADMDIFCYRNFYSMLDCDLYLLESWEEWGEKVQNSLMISTKHHPFWIKCMKLSKNNMESGRICENRRNSILESCGPKFLSKILDSSVKMLLKEIFNPKVKYEFNRSNNNFESVEYKNALSDFKRLNKIQSNIITRHYLTGMW